MTLKRKRRHVTKPGIQIKKAVFCTVAGFFSLQSLNAFAAEALTQQQQQIVRGSADAGRINQSLTQPSLAAPPPTGQAPIEQEKPVGALSPEAAKVTFKLTQIKVEGAEIFSEQDLAAPYQSYYGRTVSLGDIETIAQEMTRRYQKAGYVLSRVIIPPQRVRHGVITLRVVEGFIDKVLVQGNVRPSVAKLLEQYGENIKQVRPLQIKVLERYVLLANDLAGVNARIVLAPSQTAVGAADLTFVVQQDTASGYLTMDNRGTKFLGPEQVTAVAGVNSLFRPGDNTTLQYLTTLNNELNYGQVSHVEPLGTNGLNLILTAGATRSEPGSSLKQFDIVGRSTTTNAELSYPFIRSRSENLYLHGGVGTLDSHTTILGQDLYNDHIRFFDIGAAYSKADRWLGLNSASVVMTQGLDLLGASNYINTSRVDAQPKFTKVNIDISRLQGLPKNFSILIAGQGQFTDDSLYAAEQFGFGGQDFGRGYDPSEITGDRGMAGKAELRYDWRQHQLYAFYDIGAVWNINTVGQPDKESAASAGIGARLYLTRWLSGNVEVDKPLTKKVAAEDNRNLRVYAGVTLSDALQYRSDNTIQNALTPKFNPIPPTPAPAKAKD